MVFFLYITGFLQVVTITLYKLFSQTMYFTNYFAHNCGYLG